MSTGTLRRAPFKRVKLNASETRLWQDTLAALAWVAPGFVHILYTLLHQSSNQDDVALFTDDSRMAHHTAATDGYQLIFNPKRFFKFQLMERVFVVLHEIMHEVLNHVRVGYSFLRAGKVTVGGKTLPYNHGFANFMQDYVINAILIDAKMGKFSDEWLYNPAIADANTTWLEAYFKHFANHVIMIKNAGGFGVIDPNFPHPTTPMQFDAHLDPHEGLGDDPDEVPPRNDAQWEIIVNQAAEIQRSQGKMPAALQRFFDQVLNPKVYWADHIRGYIQRIAGSGAYDWRRLDRRLIVRNIGAPGVSGHGAGLVIIGGDTSMSVFQDGALVQGWLNEIGGIMEDVQPEEAHVVWCDTVVKRVDICTDPADVRSMIYRGIPGGGGTFFTPVFKYVEDNDLRPDALLYLTDGDGKFPKREPDYPVIWGDISGEKEKYPWGEYVRIPLAEGD